MNPSQIIYEEDTYVPVQFDYILEFEPSPIPSIPRPLSIWPIELPLGGERLDYICELKPSFMSKSDERRD